MHLHRLFADAESIGDLLVEASGNDMPEYLEFAFRQTFESPFHIRQLIHSDADFLIFPGDPLEATTPLGGVVVQGRIAWTLPEPPMPPARTEPMTEEP